MSTAKQKYLKDENGSKISPITSGDSVFDKTNNPITKWVSSNGYLNKTSGYYIFPNGNLIIQWGEVNFDTQSGWTQNGADYIKEVSLHKAILNGQPFCNFKYVSGADVCGGALTIRSSSNYNKLRITTHIEPLIPSENCKIGWFVIGVLS